MLLKEIIENSRCSFHDSFDYWRDAIAAACQPLIDEGAVEPEYVQAIIDNVEKYGPYIVIAPDICIPHAQEGKFVNKTAICFMRTRQPVSFSDNPEHDARLFFVLASTDNNLHLQNLAELVEMLSDEENVKKLLNAETVDCLRSIL